MPRLIGIDLIRCIRSPKGRAAPGRGRTREVLETFDRGVPVVNVSGQQFEGPSAVTAAVQGPLGLGDLSLTRINTRIPSTRGHAVCSQADRLVGLCESH